MSNMTVKTPNHVQRQQEQQYRRSFEQMSSGKKINRASDGAAQLAIAEQIVKEYSGKDTGSRNMGQGQDVLSIADSAMSGISDYLQRMDELSIQASNGLLSDSDRQSIQGEIDQMKQGIQGIVDQTQFNGQRLLGGSSFSGMAIATDGSSSVRIKESVNASLDSLGIRDFDVSKGDFDLNAISKALEKVSSSRSQMGAQSNRLQHGINNNDNATYNLLSAESRLMDTDFARGSSELKKQQVLRTYSLQMQQNQMANTSRMMQNFTLG